MAIKSSVLYAGGDDKVMSPMCTFGASANGALGFRLIVSFLMSVCRCYKYNNQLYIFVQYDQINILIYITFKICNRQKLTIQISAVR